MMMIQVSSFRATMLSLFSVVALSAAVLGSSFEPTRISFESLVQQDGEAKELFLRSLHEVGMISITDIPFFESKWEMLKTLPACMEDSSYANDEDELWALEHTFSDGTRRRTLATHSAGNIHAAPVPVADTDSCAAFTQASQTFRQVVGLVVEAFADHLAAALNMDETKPVLMDKASSKPFSLKDIFGEGDQLDHFHCYYSPSTSLEEQQEDTIEWHTDQGLALIFTPGLIDGELTEGFYVQLKDGSRQMVDFQPKDDLVILLGDGVHQYLNRLVDTEHSLRALPHSLQMPNTRTEDDSSNNSPRVWYGRMVLPPPSALHPSLPFTFEEIREQMIAGVGNSALSSSSASIGCSDDLIARELAETTCEEGASSYCWHRCMNYTEYDVSPVLCAEQGLDLACINDEGFLWPGNHDPQFAIGCVNLATAVNFTVTDDASVEGDNNHTDGDDHFVEGDNNHDVSSGEDSGASSRVGGPFHFKGAAAAAAAFVVTIVSMCLS